MKEVIKPRNFWTKEKCKEIVSDCLNKSELRNKYLTCYQIISRNNWMSDLESFFKENL